MTIYKPKEKGTTEDRLQKAINLGREEALRDILQWLEDNFYDYEDCNPFDFVEDTLYQCPVRCNFESKEAMLQSFKERFNMVDDCDQQYPSDFINDR